MTPAQLSEFGEALDNVVVKFGSSVTASWDTNLEAILYGMTELIEADKANQKDPAVIGCLESAIEHLREAAFLYYASFK